MPDWTPSLLSASSRTLPCVHVGGTRITMAGECCINNECIYEFLSDYADGGEIIEVLDYECAVDQEAEFLIDSGPERSLNIVCATVDDRFKSCRWMQSGPLGIVDSESNSRKLVFDGSSNYVTLIKVPIKPPAQVLTRGLSFGTSIGSTRTTSAPKRDVWKRIVVHRIQLRTPSDIVKTCIADCAAKYGIDIQKVTKQFERKRARVNIK